MSKHSSFKRRSQVPTKRAYSRNIFIKRKELEYDGSHELPEFFEKLKEAILFVCWCAGEMPLGSIRLSKIIFNADRLTYFSKLRPMIADAYVRGSQGPYLRELRLATSVLQRERLLSISHKRVGSHNMSVYEVRRRPALALLSQQEVELLQSLTEKICTEYSAEAISVASHNSAWRMAEYKEHIPLAAQLVCHATRPTAAQLEWAAKDNE